jgi:hypothetical protein
MQRAQLMFRGRLIGLEVDLEMEELTTAAGRLWEGTPSHQSLGISAVMDL